MKLMRKRTLMELEVSTIKEAMVLRWEAMKGLLRNGFKDMLNMM